MIDFDHLIYADVPVAVFGEPYYNLEATRAFVQEMGGLAIPARRIVCAGDVAEGAGDESHCDRCCTGRAAAAFRIRNIFDIGRTEDAEYSKSMRPPECAKKCFEDDGERSVDNTMEHFCAESASMKPLL
jgi:hypothetical protein